MPQLQTAQQPDGDYCNIVLLVDEETGTRSKSGRFVPDRGSVEARIQAYLLERYGSVRVVPFRRDVAATIQELRTLEPDLVFNLTEWLDGDRSLDAAITGLLEMMRLPYTGSGSDGLRLARDALQPPIPTRQTRQEIKSPAGSPAGDRSFVVSGCADQKKRRTEKMPENTFWSRTS